MQQYIIYETSFHYTQRISITCEAGCLGVCIVARARTKMVY